MANLNSNDHCLACHQVKGWVKSDTWVYLKNASVFSMYRQYLVEVFMSAVYHIT